MHSFDLGTVEAAIVSDLIRELAAGSQRFAELWAAGAASAHREDRKVVEHPAAGPVTADCNVVTDGDAELKIVMLTAAPGTADETNVRLAFLAGTVTPQD